MKNKNLGRKATDKITGFTGVITGHAEYLTGCDQYLVQPSQEDKTKYPSSEWFDEGRLTIESVEIKQEDVLAEENGCDYSAPKK